MHDEAIKTEKLTSPEYSDGIPKPNEFATFIEYLDLYDDEIDKLSAQDKISLALRCEDAARAVSPLIVNFEGGGFDTSSGSIILANSLGFAGEYKGTSCSIASVPVAAENGKMQRDYWFDVRRKLSDLDKPEDIGRIAAERTLRKLGARPVETQSVPVVFESRLAGSLMSYIFQAASGESIFRKASFLYGQLGER